MTTNFPELLKVLTRARVDFIVVGGAAATVHGSAILTQALDIVYSRSEDNIDRVALALAPYQPYLRGVPPGLPFDWSTRTIQNGLNFTLTTSLGLLDTLGEIAGGGSYPDLLPHSNTIEVYGVKCLCLNLEKLIQTKRAAGRPKDFNAIAELEAIAEEKARLE